jgi:hypothetical protein
LEFAEMPDITPGGRLVLGTAGWQRADWDPAYYPPDLPADWRLAFYANDADGVLLSAAQWLHPGAGDRAALDEAPQQLSFFLQLPVDDDPAVARALAAFSGRRVVLLASGPAAPPAGWPCWGAQGEDLWVDGASGACLKRWWLESADLRQLRARAETLPADLAALIVDGPAASPALLGDLRRLLELLGRA